MSDGFKLPSFAKINLFLRVLGKRRDGFHEICTAFQTVSLQDEIAFFEDEELILTCDNSDIPLGRDNLIVKAAETLKESLSLKNGARIQLKKVIPSSGGLAGGSSNAAVAIIGLLKLWKLKIRMPKLLEIASKIGSDVPFFLYGGTCFGLGRGEKIIPVDDISEPFILIVTPNIKVSTQKAYEILNLPYLTKSDLEGNLKICFEEKEKFLKRRLSSLNDFERKVFDIAPEIKRVKEALMDFGAKFVQMSGSGASVFAIFESEITRQAAIESLPREWKRFAVTTVSRAEYRKALEIEAVVSE
ncbi:MAG: 4-(cytidine 5'-diphospho)-2-C-methyl-D-erythritol kinase [Pyrinomonadaceae bacterium]|nr:4-(cytidine 5'-diphospho)-2-C-methyl-D-erythritol kinase [Pyrinomonadaceae bacterium]MCX7640936.1 4-(cytidine 5'-diphospho)-2-C-methyl-D-erythritol kinase [Pyrinomonadaceae bacterium]MDW8304718.1 4-(cytidine 5'-diphospho)-2-C-methyl-D-erythritol kinase [Acidobacteriota bacterium]